MLLALDTGNTQTVVGCFEGLKLIKTYRISTHPVRTGDELRLLLASFLELDGISWKSVRHVVISSVVPLFTSSLRQAFLQTGPELSVIDSSWPFSFEILPEPAHQVGADRLVNAEAAVTDYGAPCIIVDSGTATTLCALQRTSSEKIQYLGGAIMPGMELSVETLARRAAKLFSIELIPPHHAIGGNTQEALRSGVVLGYAEMIDGMVRRFKKELGTSNAHVIATGGVSSLLKDVVREFNHFDPDLTLRGIAYLHQRRIR